jgi:hypothetical protein
MDRGGAVEEQRAGQAAPDLDGDLETGFRRVERDQAQGVIDEVSGDVEEEHEAGC